MAEFRKNEAKSLMRLNERAKAVRAEKVAKKVLGEDTTGDKGTTRTRSASESEDKGGGILIGNMVEEDGVTRAVQDY